MKKQTGKEKQVNVTITTEKKVPLEGSNVMKLFPGKMKKETCNVSSGLDILKKVIMSQFSYAGK